MAESRILASKIGICREAYLKSEPRIEYSGQFFPSCDFNPEECLRAVCLFRHLLSLFTVSASAHPEESLANHLTWIFCHFPLFASRPPTPTTGGEEKKSLRKVWSHSATDKEHAVDATWSSQRYSHAIALNMEKALTLGF